jgi:glycine cleavage system H protein
MKPALLPKQAKTKQSQNNEEIHYASTHEWIIQDNGIATVGITFFSQKQLGEIVYLELPEIGTAIKAKEPIVILESTKSALEVYSPVSGKVTKVNTKIKKNLKLLNEDPEGEGWLYQMEISAPNELKELLDKKTYFSLIHLNE